MGEGEEEGLKRTYLILGVIAYSDRSLKFTLSKKKAEHCSKFQPKADKCNFELIFLCEYISFWYSKINNVNINQISV